MKKAFHITDILTVTTPFLVSNRHMTGVYEILNFMTADNLFTHQLPRAAEACRPVLLEQFPQLAKYTDELADLPYDKRCDHALLIAALEGETLEVTPLDDWAMRTDTWEVRNPIKEAVEMFGADKVIGVTP